MSGSATGDDDALVVQKFVAFPVEIIGDFISKLLGQRRTTSERFNSVFVLNTSDIVNIADIVVQRSAQNGARIVRFESQIYYE